MERKIFERIFSIKKQRHYRVVTILGLRFSFFSSKLCLKNLRTDLKPVKQYLELCKYQINKGMIDIQIRKFKKRGITGINTEKERTPQIIVSLTTFPERIGDVHYAIYSLLNQTLKPDKVILWLAKEQFPDREEDLSQEVLDLVKHGLTIKYTKDIKSYKKIIPVLKEYPNDIIVTADDDIYYPETWLEKLYDEYLKNPNNVCAHRVHKITLDKKGRIKPYEKWPVLIADNSCSFLNFATTGGGILYPPNIFYKDVQDEKLFMSLTPSCDETWLWAMTILNNIKIKVVKNPINHILFVNIEREAGFGNEITLSKENLASSKKDEQNKTIEVSRKNEQMQNIVDYYPQILSIISEERPGK